MNSGYLTTPFGRRSMTLAMLTDQIVDTEKVCDKSIDKWELYRALCQAKPLLGLSDRALALLNALLSFYPKAEISVANGLVVFPSNQALSLRSHGMAEQTIRRHMASLVEAGLLTRKDSPNGKRYARRGRAGDITQAFGFSLQPLLARSEEIFALAEKVECERLQTHLLREEISLHRRDIGKLLIVVEVEDVPGDWASLKIRLAELVSALPRKAELNQLEAHLSFLSRVHAEIVNSLKNFANSQNTSGNTSQNERHIESKPESRFDSNLSVVDPREAKAPSSDNQAQKPMSLDLVNRACPNVAILTANGSIRNAQDLMSVQPVLCSMLSINRQLLDFANNTIGTIETAVTLACLYEKGEAIASPSGYLRNLASSAKSGKFDVRPMVERLVMTQLATFADQDTVIENDRVRDPDETSDFLTADEAKQAYLLSSKSSSPVFPAGKRSYGSPASSSMPRMTARGMA
ncbi:replication initiation protein RepC [Rhizobiales bacterium RZME27]|uniref:Replication initiation protein RepC n=1 Tax=Endobacterium cereale TaxID=2663029 RepID=A0A6A8ACI9_9HYPH|nr:plasmid replication protein RepC [Endobacterium cereale]MEB2844335.1 plasmid replication protein RepC [Endobacterium cereale]MQY46926.1 replication initiation protein RepC [Endobacterium cereale]